MNPWRRAHYGYKTFLTLTFAFIYQFMIQKAFKFTVKGTFGRNSSQKVFLDGQSCHNSLLHRPPFLSVFKTLFREAYQWLGTETSSVNGFNYLLPVGQIWWWLEVTQFLPYDWKSRKMWNIEWKCEIHDGEIKSVHEEVFWNSWVYMFCDTQVQYNFISDYWMRLRMIWRIIQIDIEGVNMPRWITPSFICPILQIIQKPYTRFIIIGLFFTQNNSYFKTFFI